MKSRLQSVIFSVFFTYSRSVLPRYPAALRDLSKRYLGLIVEDKGVEPLARAVILALREPSAIMSEAGGLQTGLDGHPVTPQIATWTWERMIDALLAEPAAATGVADWIDGGDQNG